ncbi:MAG: helix-turn-helix domain-containing protein [Polyangiaceae bacterium]|nr:helix-turn-helix domain-containing protein [Polyangiaceae bacterium]
MAQYLTPKDVAGELQIAESTAREYMRAAGGIYLGGKRRHLRIERARLDAWLASRHATTCPASTYRSERASTTRASMAPRDNRRAFATSKRLRRTESDSSESSPIRPTLPRERIGSA